MRAGDFIRLKQPFTPTSNRMNAYRFGQVVALATVDFDQMVLVHLCDRTGGAILRDERGQPILYGFWHYEVEHWSDRSPA
ncbi:MAG: hypothetical protein F6K00_31050 [Leptolyngbya sp. SIOISBB]|nr:hypothetical protein [Leptolyngbya sp. SIOISBB]